MAKEAREAEKAALAAKISARLDTIFDGTIDSVLQAYVRSKEKLDDLAECSAPIRGLSAEATHHKKNILQYMLAKRIPTIVIPGAAGAAGAAGATGTRADCAEDSATPWMLTVCNRTTSSRLLTPTLFSTIMADLSVPQFLELATEVEQDRAKAAEKWRAAEFKKALSAAKKARTAAKTRLKAASGGGGRGRGRGRGRGGGSGGAGSFISKVAAAKGMADAALRVSADGRAHAAEEIIEAGRNARFVEEEGGTAAVSADDDLAAESDQDMEDRVRAQVARDTPETYLRPLTARRMLVEVVIKSIAKQVMVTRPALTDKKAPKELPPSVMVASAKEAAAVRQWLAEKRAVAEATAALKPRRAELKLSLQICESKMQPLLAAKHAAFVHTARVQERNLDKEGNQMVRTISAKIVRREVCPKTIRFTAFQDIVRQLDTCGIVAWEGADVPFDPVAHTVKLLRQPTVDVMKTVLLKMKQYLESERRIVERVCIRRARPRSLADYVTDDPYAELEEDEGGEGEGGDSDGDDGDGDSDSGGAGGGDVDEDDD